MTKDEILIYFRYDRVKGQLIWINHWRASTRSRLFGKVAGNTHRQKNCPEYRKVEIASKQYFIHHLIWILENGEPAKMIDHIDGNGLNNHISNLRETDKHKNARNLKIHRKGRLQNCYFCKTANRWRAEVTIDKERIRIGRFDTEQEAHEASLKVLESRGVL